MSKPSTSNTRILGRLWVSIRQNKYLLLVLLLALLLRLPGVTHGFPFITHPDEPSVVRSAIGLRFNPNPKHFDWPHLYFYANYFLYAVFNKLRIALQLWGLRPAVEGAFPLMWRDPLVFYFLSRVLSVVLGALTVIPVYLSAHRLWGKTPAVLAALAFALIPFHVWHSHYALVDVPATFWVAWAVYFACGILQSPRLLNYALAGLMVGFAASTKYNGGLAVIAIPVAHLLRTRRVTVATLQGPIIAAVTAVVGFLAGTPFALLDFDTFRIADSPAGALWQFTNVGKVTFLRQWYQLGYNLVVKLTPDFGYTLLIAYVAVLGLVVYWVYKKKALGEHLPVVFVLVSSLVMFWYVSGFERTRSHYYMVTYPFVALIAGYAGSKVLHQNAHRVRNRVVVTLLFGIPVLFAIYNSLLFFRTTTFIMVYDWMQMNVTETDLLSYDNAVFPVIEKFANKHTKNLSTEDVQTRHGYLIKAAELSPQGELYEMFSLVQVFPNTFRYGPTLYIYEFGAKL